MKNSKTKSPVKASKSPASSKAKTTSSKSKASSGKSKTTATMSAGKVHVNVDKDSSISVREIENGYVVSESGTTGKGKNSRYYSKEYYSDKNPVQLNMPTSSKKPTFGSKNK